MYDKNSLRYGPQLVMRIDQDRKSKLEHVALSRSISMAQLVRDMIDELDS